MIIAALKDAIVRLITTKGIIAIILTIVYSVLAVNNTLSVEFNSLYLIIIGFYFGDAATK